MSASITADEAAQKILAETYTISRFPLGTRVRDREGQTGVVLGYRDQRLVVQLVGVPTTDAPPPDLMRAEDVWPVVERPTRDELLNAIERTIISVCKTSMSLDTVESLCRARRSLIEGV